MSVAVKRNGSRSNIFQIDAQVLGKVKKPSQRRSILKRSKFGLAVGLPKQTNAPQSILRDTIASVNDESRNKKSPLTGQESLWGECFYLTSSIRTMSIA